MANVAVKFYSVASLPAQASQGALYFVAGGELYKGSQRFGCAKVFEKPTEGENIPENPPATGVARGDIALGWGGAKVYDGTAWKELGADTAALQSMWQADISSAISSLVSTFGTGDSDGQVKLGGSNATVNGWSTVKSDISFLKSVVTSSTEDNVTTTEVTANTGTFDNLTVTNTATFTATEIEASSLTINGSTVEEIIAASATSSIDASGSLLPTESAVANYVDGRLSSFGNVMHFTGVVTELPSKANDGDVVVIGALPSDYSGTLVAGQEYVYASATGWGIIGDENAPTGGSSTADQNGVYVTVDIAAATAAPTVSLSGFGVAATKSVATTLDASSANLPTESAVASYVATQISAAELLWLDENNQAINVGS